MIFKQTMWLKCVTLLLLVAWATSASAQCTLEKIQITTGDCNQNGTPFDPTDDYFEVTVYAEATNGGADNQFNVVVGTDVHGPFDYGTGGTFIVGKPDSTVYTLELQDANDPSCFSKADVQQFPCCELNITPTVIPSIGGDTLAKGEIEFCFQSGTAPFEFIVSPDTTNASLYLIPAPENCNFNYLLSGLDAGKYDVTIKDAKGCKTTFKALEVANTTACTTFKLESISAKDPVNCKGGSDGTAQLVNFDKGNASFIVVDPGNGLPTQKITDLDGEIIIEGLPAGEYNISIFDDKGCEITYLDSPVVVNEPEDSVSVSASVIQHVSAEDTKDGEAFLCAKGGNGGFQVSILPDTIDATIQSTSCLDGEGFQISGLPKGNIQAVVTDANGCLDTVLLIVNDPSCDFRADSLEVKPNVCGNDNKGEISFHAFGTAPYQVSLDGGATFSGSYADSSVVLNNLEKGRYDVIVQDASGCQLSLPSNHVTDWKSPIEIKYIRYHATYKGNSDGSIQVCVSGGTPPYNFIVPGLAGPFDGQFDNGWDCDSTYWMKDLGAGTYTLQVLDADNCVETVSVEVLEPSCTAFSAPTTKADSISCYGANDGQIEITTNGGKAPFTYEIVGILDNITTTVETVTTNDPVYTFEGLDEGRYEVFVRDANGCFAPANSPAVVEQPRLLRSTNTVIQPCEGGENGVILLTPDGGTPGDYSYEVLNEDKEMMTVIESDTTDCAGNGAFYVPNVKKGKYHIALTDINGCVAHGIVNVDETIVFVNVTPKRDCSNPGKSTGAVTATVNGGSCDPAFTYAWSTGATDTLMLKNIDEGTYTITATDRRGCTGVGSGEVERYQPTPILKPVATCVGQSNGAVSIQEPVDGFAPITYQWSTGATTAIISDLASGTYTVTATDAEGCTDSNTATVEEYQLQPTVSVDNICGNDTNGAVNVTITNTNGVVNYAWSNGASTQNLQNVSAGVYTVTATDALNCQVTAQGEVVSSEIPTATPSEDVTIERGKNTTISVSASGGSGNYTYQWSGGATSSSVEVAPTSTVTYTVVVTDAETGCSTTARVTVTVVPPVIVEMPNAFSPNGDGNNDNFAPYIPNQNVELVTFSIFDRWGVLMYDNVSTTGWDGVYNGTEQPVGTYVYVVEFLNNLGEKQTLKGDFSLVR